MWSLLERRTNLLIASGILNPKRKKGAIMIHVFVAVVCLIGVMIVSVLPRDVIPGAAARALQVGLVLLGIFSLASTSYVTIGNNEVGLLSRIYWANPLPEGHIIAVDNEKGPQAEVLTPGFHFRLLLNVLYSVKRDQVIVVPAGHYGQLVANDGEPLRPGQTFAEQIGPIDKMLDAAYFLTHHGQKGPQTVVITPGTYRINTYLWQVLPGDSTDVPKGFVAVVKSNVHSAVNFGNLAVLVPQDCQPTKETDLSGGKLAVPLVHRHLGHTAIAGPLLSERGRISDHADGYASADMGVQGRLHAQAGGANSGSAGQHHAADKPER